MYKSVLKIVKQPIFRIAVSLLIISILLLTLPLQDLWGTIQKISIFSWLIVLIGFVAGHLMGTFKWRLLINMGKRKLPFWVALRCYFAGLFANLFLPSLAGGDIVKTGLAIRYNKEKGVTIFGSLLDRLIDTVSVVFVVFCAALLSPKFFQAQDQRIVYSVLALIFMVFLTGLMLLVIPTPQMKNEKIRNLINRIKEIVGHVFKNPAKPMIAFVISIGIQSGFILLTVYLANILQINMPLAVWFLIWPLAKLSALLPISMGGIGVREVALAALLSRLYVPVSDSVALGFLWESILISGGILGGILYLILTNVSGEKVPSLTSISPTN
jgi:uncharacterized membrane protein YbhN (UPF0104 family)